MLQITFLLSRMNASTLQVSAATHIAEKITNSIKNKEATEHTRIDQFLPSNFGTSIIILCIALAFAVQNDNASVYVIKNAKYTRLLDMAAIEQKFKARERFTVDDILDQEIYIPDSSMKRVLSILLFFMEIPANEIHQGVFRVRKSHIVVGDNVELQARCTGVTRECTLLFTINTRDEDTSFVLSRNVVRIHNGMDKSGEDEFFNKNKHRLMSYTEETERIKLENTMTLIEAIKIAVSGI